MLSNAAVVSIPASRVFVLKSSRVPSTHPSGVSVGSSRPRFVGSNEPLFVGKPEANR